MINREEFTKEQIKLLSTKHKVKEEHLEKLMYAFQLLEDLVNNQINFIFKGGTSLLLVTKNANRLSIDIDILVDTDKKEETIKKILSLKSEYFKEVIKQKRNPKPGVDKEHFEFHYDSYLEEKPEEMFVLLDVVFDSGIFASLKNRIISTKYISFVEPLYSVVTPSLDELLGY